MKKAFFILFLSLFLTETVRATHIVGGEIYYDYKGNDTFKITLKLYRDCLNGQAPYDDPAYIFIFNTNGNLVDSIPIVFPGSTRVPPLINSPCFAAPTDICVEQAIYSKNVFLPPAPGGYNITYQRCCRNGTILNLQNPGSVGSTYMAHIPDPSLAIGNSSPRYKQFPPIYICANNPLVFDHSAHDPDGDSLAYSFCDAYDGASTCCPILGPAGQTNGCGSGCPMIAPPPPYVFVPYASPYSGAYPMSSSPAMSIDPHTGLITGTPNMIGQWVVAVCVSEYRHGKLLSVNKRDFQFNVTPCPAIPVAAVPSQQVFCFGDTVQFSNNSINATSYQWNFGDPNSGGTNTSGIVAPMHIYSDTGVYHVTLICNPGSPCADTGHTTFYIYPLLKPSFVSPLAQCLTNNSFGFTAGGHFLGNGSFHWNFGPAALPDSSQVRNPSGIHYSAAGSFPVTLTVSENGCQQAYTDSVRVLSPASPLYLIPPFKGCPPEDAQFSAPVIDPELQPSYSWTFGDGTSASGANVSHTYTQTGTYDVHLVIITNHACLDTFMFSKIPAVTVYPTPEAQFTSDSVAVIMTNASVLFTDLIPKSDSSTCIWNFGDGTVSHNTVDSIRHIFPHAVNVYNVLEIRTNKYGCSDTFKIPIEVYSSFEYWIPNAFTPNDDGINDIFRPIIAGVSSYELDIFNRWGELIFSSETTAEGWNGTYKGNRCQEDVYVWKVGFINDVSKHRENYIGRVSLIR
ncbi:MAG TPA: PKD domain-containing protein [Bacteroidia bacterium]|jgi:gliding motility-associated-like protein|nr:PKD domain-containing protein [Bacteroidia bacterium]